MICRREVVEWIERQHNIAHLSVICLLPSLRSATLWSCFHRYGLQPSVVMARYSKLQVHSPTNAEQGAAPWLLSWVGSTMHRSQAQSTKLPRTERCVPEGCGNPCPHQQACVEQGRQAHRVFSMSCVPPTLPTLHLCSCSELTASSSQQTLPPPAAPLSSDTHRFRHRLDCTSVQHPGTTSLSYL